VPPAGYSGTPLAKKLGIKPESRVALLSAPEGFEAELEGLPDGVDLRRRLAAGTDLVVLFTTRRRDLERRFETAARAVHPAGSVWVAWPKRSSGIETDLNENVLRDVCLPHGLVDNKVCAVDDDWSGLRFVWRLENR